jgi:hypothetical protein
MRNNPCRAISLDDSEYNADGTTFGDAGLDQRHEILVGREMLSACGSRVQYHEREKKQAATDSDNQVRACVPLCILSEIAFFIIRLSYPNSFADMNCSTHKAYRKFRRYKM